MDAAETLREARRRARLSQRDLAERTGIAQPTIARIERSTTVPRVDTLERLLNACDVDLSTSTRPTVEGQEWAQVEQQLRLTPQQRVEKMLAWANLAREFRLARLARD